MSHRSWSLLSLRGDMRQGKPDALPGMPTWNKAQGYWLPLQEVRLAQQLRLPHATMFSAREAQVY